MGSLNTKGAKWTPQRIEGESTFRRGDQPLADLESTDDKPTYRRRVLPVSYDPRSPSVEISRTPIDAEGTVFVPREAPTTSSQFSFDAVKLSNIEQSTEEKETAEANVEMAGTITNELDSSSVNVAKGTVKKIK